MENINTFILIFIQMFELVTNTPPNTEQKLLSIIFKTHSPYARPTLNSSKPLEVKFGIELVQLVSVDEMSQSLTTKLWVRQIWENSLLTWKATDWGGVDRLNVHADYVWKPDIVLYNNAGETFAGGVEQFKTLVNLYSDGVNAWLSPATFKSTCKIDVKYFPFDIQVCSLKFGSWAMDATKIDLKEEGSPMITQQYLNSSEWDVIDVKIKFHSIKYKCCPNPYTDLTFTFVLKRRPLYYVVNIIAPCIVLVLMVMFNFLLPAESGERLSLNITVMLALAVFLQSISNSLPRNSDSTPILSLFFIILMSESALALVATVLVLAIHHKGKGNCASRPPRWLQKCFLGVNSEKVVYQGSIRLCSIIKLLHKYDVSIEEKKTHKSVELMKIIEDNFKSVSGNHDNLVIYSLQDILGEMSKINQSMQRQVKRDDVDNEWKTLGKALDRFFFWMFLFILIATAMVTLVVIYREKRF